MEKLITPPTDNLYKFVSIFGLVLIGISIVIPYNPQRSLDQKESAFEANALEYNADTENFWLIHMSPEQLKNATKLSEVPAGIAKTETERDAIRDEHESALDQLAPLCAVQTVEAIREAHKKPEYKQHIMERFGIPEERYADFMAKQTDEGLTHASVALATAAQQMKAKTNKFYALAYDLWNSQDHQDTLVWYCRVSGAVGLFFTLVGFVLWWWKVQRYEDAILKKKAGEVMNLPASDGPLVRDVAAIRSLLQQAVDKQQSA